MLTMAVFSSLGRIVFATSLFFSVSAGPPWLGTPGGELDSRESPVFIVDYNLYPQSCENICYSWFCNNGPQTLSLVASNNNCSPERCNTEDGLECNQWHSDLTGAVVSTRCIPGAENKALYSAWTQFLNSHQDNLSMATIKISNVPPVAYTTFCAGLLGAKITDEMCRVLDHGVPALQR
ncbi:hypothetical protein BDZ89DRAFT_1072167 [Hymenopellis radicata]|nr:hypothetical protein BDZ89DRAFT_1072167 [Hymenopellis radicata]